MIVRKLIVSDGRTERELLLVGTIVVGRDPSCQLNDLDPLLSRRHAEFVPTSKGVTIRDLNSRNGILVNGDKVPEYALKPGDVIQLGHLHVRYVEEPVVKSAEDHSRVRAKTETGIEVPTMAVAPRPAAAAAPSPVPAAASAPTEAAPAKKATDETDLDVTIAPPARRPAAVPAPPVHAAPASLDDTDLDVTVAPAALRAAAPAAPAPPRAAADADMDATIALARRPEHGAPHAAPSAGDEEDADSTRLVWAKATAVADPDATVASPGISFDETRGPVRAPAPAVRPKIAAPTEARLVANMSLVVTEASPSCQKVIGARPDTIIGGQLADAVGRSLRFVATGDGPASLSMSVARTPGNTITVIFKTGQATESHS